MVPYGIPNDIDPSVRSIVAATLRRIAARQMHSQDRGDLSQHLLLRVLEGQRRYEPRRGTPPAYAAVVVRTALANYLRDRSASKRASHPTTSAGDTFRQLADPRGGRDRELRDLAIDVADVLARLPPEVREVAEELKRGSVSDAARALGRPRTSLYARLATLRGALDRAGLRPFR